MSEVRRAIGNATPFLAGPSGDPQGQPSIGGRRFISLPNGMEIACQTAAEASFFYHDIFEDLTYCRHGISLENAQCIFDVGANIGLFALFAAHECPQAALYAFEPAPPLYEILRWNVERFGVQAKLFDFGLSDSPATAELTFYPNSSGMSSFYGNRDEEEEALQILLNNSLRAKKPGMDELIQHAGDLIEERLRSCAYQCRLRPLSEVIRRHGIQRIDLLKVDVQKSELDVIRGIEEEHWPLIRQLVIEVHNTRGQLQQLDEILRRQGFHTLAAQDSHYRGSVMFNLYASRAGLKEHPPQKRPRSRKSRAVDAMAEEDGEERPSGGRPWKLLLLSAKTPSALEAASEALSRHLAEHPNDDLADIAYTLQADCKGFDFRRMLVCRSREEAAQALISQDPKRILSATASSAPLKVAFMLPGLGNHYLGMASETYRHKPVFRGHLDTCAEALKPHLGLDLRSLLFSERASPAGSGSGLDFRAMLTGGRPRTQGGEQLIQTRLAQPVLFSVEYALARQWMHWGVQPQAMIGYSLGEYVAACLAGVFPLQDALRLVARRAQMIDGLPKGSMLAVPLSESEVKPLLGDRSSLAAVNGPCACVVAGPPDAISGLERQLTREGHACRRLAASHAFHSKMMQPIRRPFAQLVEQMQPRAPQIPFVSNLTGDWITPGQATDPAYWADHLCQAVRFAAGVSRLLEDENRALLEVGPGQALGAWALQLPDTPRELLVASSLPHCYDRQPDLAALLNALGKLWLAGAEVDWGGFHGTQGQRIRFPNGFFEGSPQPLERPPSSGLPERPQARYAEPRNSLEQRLCQIWQGLLGLGQVGIHDKFFEVGGDSLKAARLIAQLKEEFSASLSLRKLFQLPTIAELSVAIVQQQASQIESGLLAQAMAEIQRGQCSQEGAGQEEEQG